MRYLFALMLALAFSMSSLAQDWMSYGSSSRQYGSFTYTDYYTPYGIVTGVRRQYGSYTYEDFDNGWRSVTRQYGSYTYTDFEPPIQMYRYVPRVPYSPPIDLSKPSRVYKYGTKPKNAR
jgi:hypothetical protein